MKFSPQSKVWIYQSDRKMSDQEVEEISLMLHDFTQRWKAHGYQLQAKAEVLYNYFIVLFAEEQGMAQVSGCSISSSMDEIDKIGQKFNIDFFNRYNMAYKIDDEVQLAKKEDFETLITTKQIGLDTIVFNNLVLSLDEFEHKWEVALKDSWHKQIFAEQLNA